jgi:flagellar biosynthesis protein
MDDSSKMTLSEMMKKKAVALSSKGKKDNIPTITATGTGKNAEKILDLAFTHGVKVRKDDDLIQILTKFEEDSQIPIEALEAVSEILTHLYNENIRLDPSKHLSHNDKTLSDKTFSNQTTDNTNKEKS